MKNLPAIISPREIFLNPDGKYALDQENSEWVNELLQELNENSDYDDEILKKLSFLNLNFKLMKFHDSSLGETLLLNGTIKATYCTRCIKSLEPMELGIDVPLKAAFVPEFVKDEEAYKDVTESYLKDGIYEIYFEENRKFNLKEVFHEQIYLNVDFFPKIEVSDSN